MDPQVTTGLLEELTLNEPRSEEPQPISPEAFMDRFFQWSQEAEKRNRGGLGVSFTPFGQLSCVANASIWGLTDDEYRAGKQKMAVSPQPHHTALSSMFAVRHEEMGGFLNDFDLEADPTYEGMVPGTVTLNGYMGECNRFKGLIAAQSDTATSTTASQICGTCLELCLDGDIVSKMLKAGLKDVETSATRGCPSCAVLLDGIASFEPDFHAAAPATGAMPQAMDAYSLLQRQGYSVGDTKTAFGDNEKVINGAYGRGCGLCVTYVYRNGPKDLLGTAVDLDFFVKKEDVPCPWKSIRVATEISGDTSSAQSFSRAAAWLENCHQAHKSCSKSITGPLPDRVLDLCTIDISSTAPIKLIETKNEDFRYTCLSYCWGKAVNLTMTTKNLEDHKNGIRWDALPQTFRDAITFTRRLGIRYLWIDSLCIIQDNKKDWERQASKMPAIYENSYVTLAATASDSSGGGCFHKADPKYTARTLSAVARDGKSHQIFVRQHLPHWLSADSRYREPNRSEFPILCRGWVLQERLLAPRVIHFGHHELMWECMQGAACECSFLDQVEDDHLDKLLHHRNMVPEPKGIVVEGQAALQQLYETSTAQRWRKVVSRYSRLSLTKETDIFPALSGIARQMNRETKDTYIAGLWEKNLPIDLLWEVSTPKYEPAGPWKAPSWSWAHRKFPVHWVDDLQNECEPEIHLKVLEAKQVPAGENDMGEISSAWLVVDARLCPAVLVVYAQSPEVQSPKADLKMDGVYLNSLPDPSEMLYFLSMEIKLDSLLPPTTQYRARYDTSSEKLGRNVFCMRVATLSSKEYSLILWFNQDKGSYERIGMVSQYVGPVGTRDMGRIPWHDDKKCLDRTITLV